MKRILFPIFIIVLAAGCQSNKNDDDLQAPVDTIGVNTEQNITVTNNVPLWYVDETNNVEKLKEPQVKSIETLSPSELIKILNERNTDVALNLEGVSHDTVFLSIPKSNYLTNQMGSTGAYNYLAEVVYNFTELKPIHYVRLSFEEGEHAVPGVYSREDFKRLR